MGAFATVGVMTGVFAATVLVCFAWTMFVEDVLAGRWGRRWFVEVAASLVVAPGAAGLSACFLILLG